MPLWRSDADLGLLSASEQGVEGCWRKGRGREDEGFIYFHPPFWPAAGVGEREGWVLGR